MVALFKKYPAAIGEFLYMKHRNDYASDIEANFATASAVPIDDSRLTYGTVSWIKTGEDNIRSPDCLSIN